MLALGLSVNVGIHRVTVPPKVTVAPSAETSGAETAAPICPGAQTSCRPNGERPKSGAQTAAPICHGPRTATIYDSTQQL